MCSRHILPSPGEHRTVRYSMPWLSCLLPQLTARYLLMILLMMGGLSLQPHQGKSSGQVLEMMGVAAAITWKWKPWCNFMECCDTPWINVGNMTGLDKALQQNLFGQHIAYETVLAAVEGHLSNPDPPKPLVLSFHGRTGTGKNFVSRHIVDSIYKMGMQSKYVHLKIADRDFRHASKLQEYKDSLYEEVQNSIKSCPRQLFIFDEVENMPPGLLDTIRPYLEYRPMLDGVDYSKSIFIMLSNTASREISTHILNHLQAGKAREDITLEEMEEKIESHAFNLAGSGFEHARLIDKYLISHFIPFLPLETSHVRECIRAEIRHRSPGYSINVELVVEQVLKELQFWPKGLGVFANKGCKSVAEKLNLALFRYHRMASRLDDRNSRTEL